MCVGTAVFFCDEDVQEQEDRPDTVAGNDAKNVTACGINRFNAAQIVKIDAEALFNAKTVDGEWN